MKDKLKRIVLYWLPYGILFFMMLAVHLNIDKSADDMWFEKILDSQNMFAFLKERYLIWSSRVIIEAILINMTHISIMFWRVLDTFFMVGIAWVIAQLIDEKNNRISWTSCIFCLIYPFNHMSGAGYMACTINYIWPLFFVLLSFYLLKRIITGKRIYIWDYPLSIISLVVGANSEQGAAILFGGYILVISYWLIKKKKVPVIVIVQFIVVVAELVFIISCPGNSVRKSSEITTFFPEYNNLGILRLIEMGITSALYHFVFLKNFVGAFFTMALWLKARDFAETTSKKLVCATPFVISISFSIFSDIFYGLFPQVSYFKESLTRYGTYLTDSKNSILPCLLYAINILTILYGVFLLKKENEKEAFLILGILILGFGSRFMMCFSASIWVSGNRTYLYMYFALIIATIYMLNTFKSERVRTIFMYLIGIVGSLTYLTMWVNIQYA